MAMNTYAKVHSSTPTRAMELITDTFPLKLYLQKEATCAYVRLQDCLTLTWTGVNRSGSQRSHLKSLQHLVRDLGVHEIMLQRDTCDTNNPGDVVVMHDTFADREAYRNFLSLDEYPIQVFTDGSKMNGRVGSAFRIKSIDGILHDSSFRLPDRCSVYQAELSAIRYAAKKISDRGYVGSVVFFVDSQAAMLGLQSARIQSQVVLDTILEVNKLQDARFVWVKSHSGIEDNDAVDELAKAATRSEVVRDTPIPKQEIKSVVLEALRAIWNEEWNEYGEARMSKKWYGNQDKYRAKEACALSRLKLGRLIRIITGHNALNYYSYVLDHTFSPACRLCKMADETFHHLATECPMTLRDRDDHFGDKDILTNMSWDIQELLNFSYSDLINPLLDPNDVHHIELVDTESDGED